MGWPEIVMQSLKDHEVNIIAYVPDVVIWRILSKLENDPYFRVVPAAREEEAMGIIVGAYAAKKRGAVFMQSSGLGNCINALGSMCIPWRIPFPFYISMRGESGEFNPAQMPMGKAVRPILDAMGLAHFTLDKGEELEKVVMEAMDQCYSHLLPVGVLLSTILTGGKLGAS
jgi:sulfopyruvate decarboxylase alpha subunit